MREGGGNDRGLLNALMEEGGIYSLWIFKGNLRGGQISISKVSATPAHSTGQSTRQDLSGGNKKMLAFHMQRTRGGMDLAVAVKQEL